jgi:DNA repair protein RadC
MFKNPGQVADAACADEFTYVADETLLAYATGITIVKAQKLLKDRSLQELANDPVMAGRLRACVNLARRLESPRPKEPEPYYSSTSVRQAFRWLTQEVEEQVWIVYLDARHRPIFEERITRGSPHTASVSIRPILLRAVKVGAVGMVMVHNHPSNEPEPSVQDDDLTQALRTAAQAIECSLLDHVIVALAGSFSYLDAGKLTLP